MQPSVGVAIPTRRRPEYLDFCLASVAEQTLAPADVFVSEDGRDAGTADVVSRYANALRIRHVVNDPPLGELLNRRQAFRDSGGVFVAMVDDDDAWEPRFLEVTSRMLIEHPECGFCSADHWWMDATGETLVDVTETNSRRFGRDVMRTGVYDDVLLRHLTLRPFAFQATLFRRDSLASIGYVPEGDQSAALDYSIFLELGAERVPAAYVAERLGRYRTHAGQMTHRRALMSSSTLTTLTRIAGRRDLSAAERRALADLFRRQVVEAAIAQAHLGARREALSVLGRFFEQGAGTPPPSRIAVLAALLLGVARRG